MTPHQTEIAFALFALCFGLAALGIWIPWDVDTGMIETFRRQTIIGDAFLPVLAAAAIAICALLQLIAVLLRRSTPSDAFKSAPLSRSDLMLLGIFLAVIAASLLVMFWAGPLLSFWNENGYRGLRGHIPFKYTGFFLGGTVMLTGLISIIEGRLRPRIPVISALATTFLIVLFDLPFDSILLPPNGDW